MKVCPSCKRNLGLEKFSKHKNRYDGLQSQCRDCISKLHHDWYEKNKAEVKDASRTRWKSTRRGRHLLATYGIDEWQYAEMYVEQGAGCSICGKHKEILHVDHDHNTGKIRGLLCGNCNLAIGLLKHDPQIIIKASNYVQQIPIRR